MRKYLLILFLTLNLSLSANYVATNLAELIEKSKIIVYGEIISVGDETIKIVSRNKIKNTNLDTLTIKKFINWTCASRYSNYELGQKGIFFLYPNDQNQLEIIGAGNEGELIVRSDTTFIPFYNQKRHVGKIYPFISKYKKYITLDITTVIRGIKLYIDNLEDINKELTPNTIGTTAYQYSYIDKLPKNAYLTILIDQKQGRVD